MKQVDYVVATESENLVIDIEQKRKQITDEIVTALIAERKRRGLTQQDIADISGMKAPNVTRIESCKYSPSLDVLMRYANAVGKQLYIGLTDVTEADECRVAESVTYHVNQRKPLPIGISDY